MSHSVVVRSVGAAKPQVAVAIAHGLGLPVDRTLQAIYRAPARLVSALDEKGADRLADLLRAAGLDVDVLFDEAAVVPPELFDVAVRVDRDVPLLPCLRAIAGFCACDEKRALDLLSRPPGMVLGSVSRSTADALALALRPFRARVVAAPLASSRYLAFVTTESAPLEASIRSSIDQELERAAAGETPAGPTLSFDASQRLWARFGRMGALRIVNEAFLTFDIWLEGALEGSQPDPEGLERLAGVPPHHCAAVIAAAPVTLQRSVALGELAGLLDAYAAAGFRVRGEMSSFARGSVRVRGGGTGPGMQAVAALFDLPPPTSSPWQSPVMTLVRATLLAGALDDAGARTELVEGGDD